MAITIDFITAPAVPAAGRAAEPVTVLVVDDSPVDRRLAGSIVERGKRGSVLYAGNGREALDVLGRAAVHAIVTDLLMPELDGLELVEAVRQRYPFIPVVLMTGYGSEDLAVQALQRGASSYVPKKSLPRDLGPTLDRVLSVARWRRDQDRLRSCLTGTEAHFVLDNDPELVPALLTFVQEQAACLGLSDQSDAIRLGIAVEEAVLNGIYHGNLEIGAARTEARLDPEDLAAFDALVQERRRVEPYSRRRLHVDVSLSRKEAVFVVRDEGAGFDPATLPDPTDPVTQGAGAGRGMLLIRTFMDEVRFNAKGNEVTLVKRMA